jgi:O-antigen/teichoic acid export membrane protein
MEKQLTLDFLPETGASHIYKVQATEAKQVAEIPAASGRQSVPRQVLAVAAGTLLVAVLTFLAIRIYSQRYGVEAVSAVLLFRLFGAALTALMTLAMPISLQRNVAFLLGEPKRAASAAVAGLAIGTGTIAIGCAAAAYFAVSVAHFAGYRDGAVLWQACMALVFAQAVSSMIAMIGMARGEALSSSLQTALAYGVAPILPLLLWPRAPLGDVIWYSAWMVGIAIVPFALKVAMWIARSGIGGLGGEARKLLNYGLPRMIGNVAEFGAESAMPVLAIGAGAGLQGAGYLAAGLALLRPLNPISSALNTVMISSTAKLVSANDEDRQRIRLERATEWSLEVGLFATTQLVLWCDVLIELWLGPDFRSAVPVVRLLSFSLLPVFLFQSLRGIIDGASETAVNTKNVFIALGVLGASTLLSAYWHLGPLGIAGAYLISKLTLGALTTTYFVRRQGLVLRSGTWLRATVVAFGLGLLSIALRSWAGSEHQVSALLVSTLLAAPAFIWITARQGSAWAQFLMRRFA